MAYKIYLVEDDKNLNRILSTYLEKEGYLVKSFLDGLVAREYILNPPDLWILDIMLPNIDGYQLIKEIKNQDKNTPVIFMSARDKDIDRVIGLEYGSDDYLTKPFLPRELIIRTKNILSRHYGHRENSKLGPYLLDQDSRRVFLDQEEIDLTTKEYEMILLFFKNPDKALSRDFILDHIWGADYFGSNRVVDDLIRRVRSKLDRLEIETIYGYGYRVIV